MMPTLTPIRPPGTPGDNAESMKTRVIVLDADREYEELSMLKSYDKVANAAWGMKYGDVHGMLHWCKKHGGQVPWEVRKLFGKIPLPWAALLSIIVLVLATERGVSIRWAMILTLLVATLILAAGFWSTTYTHGKKGNCIVCGADVAEKHKRPIEVYGANGKQRKVSQSGYCEQHAWTVYRHSLWHIVEVQIWRGIKMNPVRNPNILRRFGYGLFFWLGYRQQFLDPRPVGGGFFYELKDRRNPRDTLNKNVLNQTLKLLFMSIDNLQNLERTRRRI